MRAQFEAVIDELKRLKGQGLEALYLGDTTAARLKEMAAAAAPAKAPAATRRRTPRAAPKVNLLDEWKQQTTANGETAEAATKAGPAPDKSKTTAPPIPPPTPFELPNGDKAARWSWLRDKVLKDPVCREHTRQAAGKQVVFGVGSLEASIFFCGEAPGAEEEAQGEPFVGKAGQLLDKIIQAMGLRREEVYIGNIMNWRPEHDKPFGNRPPNASEIAYCLPYLEAQVAIVQPQVIVALGATAAHGLLGHDPQRTVSRTRGKWLEFRGTPLILTYHPSYLLRNDTLKSKRMVWEDMLLVMEKTGLPISERQKSYFQKDA